MSNRSSSPALSRSRGSSPAMRVCAGAGAVAGFGAGSSAGGAAILESAPRSIIVPGVASRRSVEVWRAQAAAPPVTRANRFGVRRRGAGAAASASPQLGADRYGRGLGARAANVGCVATRGAAGRASAMPGARRSTGSGAAGSGARLGAASDEAGAGAGAATADRSSR